MVVAWTIENSIKTEKPRAEDTIAAQLRATEEKGPWRLCRGEK